jgi:hypothetical protein
MNILNKDELKKNLLVFHFINFIKAHDDKMIKRFIKKTVLR